jgi:hypothetical protein
MVKPHPPSSGLEAAKGQGVGLLTLLQVSRTLTAISTRSAERPGALRLALGWLQALRRPSAR